MELAASGCGPHLQVFIWSSVFTPHNAERFSHHVIERFVEAGMGRCLTKFLAPTPALAPNATLSEFTLAELLGLPPEFSDAGEFSFPTVCKAYLQWKEGTCFWDPDDADPQVLLDPR